MYEVTESRLSFTRYVSDDGGDDNIADLHVWHKESEEGR